MTTAVQLITRALRGINVLGAGETPSPDMASDALATLNDMLALWSNESLMVYQSTLENFSLVAAQATYTMGTGGNFNTARPTKIDSAYIRWNSIDYPLSIVTTEQYDSISLKTSPNQIPCVMLVDAGYPLTTLKLFPVPNDATAQIFIESRKPFTGFASLTDVVNLPPGYDMTIHKSLSVELIPEYGGGSPLLAKQAANGKKWLKRTNFEPLIMTLDSALPQGRGSYDQNGNYL